MIKRNGFPQIIFRVYLHCWYVPLFIFLLGIKICLISHFVYTVENEGKTVHVKSELNDPNVVSPVSLGSHRTRSKRRVSTVTTTSTTTISPERLKDLETLNDLENSHIEATDKNRTDPNSIWLIFNRIPRCGGETMVDLMIQLSEQNRFNHQEHEYRTPWPRFLLEQEQESLVTWFEYQHLPKSYDRHFYFVNFTRYQKYVKEQPIYMNMIREPAQRLRSFFLSKRANVEIAKAEIMRRNDELPNSGMHWYEKRFEECVTLSDPECSFENDSQDFTMAVPFFCGQHPACVLINNKWALQRAKFTIEKHYSVVGVLERWNQTLKVLENYIPRFFSGAAEFYHQLEKRSRKTTSPEEIPEIVQAILERKIPAEFELYQFINQRLTAQYDRLVRGGQIRQPRFEPNYQLEDR